MSKLTNRFIILLLSVFVISACSKEELSDLETAEANLASFLNNIDQDKLDAELAVIDDSLAARGLIDQVQIDSRGGVRYIIRQNGDGKKPELTSVITFTYSGKLLKTGFKFDNGNEFTTYLKNLIIGYQTVLPGINEGSKVTLYIPSLLGYGSQVIRDQQGNVKIPAYSNLVFDIELVDVR
jgi:FKBP-type peptidyl-prolyl cis-trans isomerase